MTKIYLIRHAEAEGNLYRRAQGQFDVPLTPRGERQALALGERFRDTPLDAVYASDLRRARQTAQAVAQVRGLPVRTEPRLREIGLGVWEDRPWGDLMAEYPEQYAHFSHDTDRWQVEGSEPHAALRARMLEALGCLAAEHEGQTIAAVSHGMALRSLLSALPGEGTPSHAENTAVSLVEAENGDLRVVWSNDCSHLPPELRTLMRQAWWRSADGRDLSSLRFRPMEFPEQERLYTDCYADAWLCAHGSLRGFDRESYLDSARRRAAPETLLAAYCGDDFAGILDLDDDQSVARGAGWISLCYIVPAFRGRHFGIQLVGQAISHFRRQGRRSLQLSVSEDNAAARSFYKACGFYERSRLPGCIAPLIIMEKGL